MGSIVYHYTDMQAFGGMVERTGLWATDFRYLNDSRELTYTWEPFVQRLRDLSADEGPHAASYAAQLKALELMNSTDLMLYDDSIFVACFTELDDAVSQWSRYGANGHGVAMGFDSEAIQALKAPFFNHAPGGELLPVTDQNKRHVDWPAYLQKVKYGDEERDQLVDGLLGIVERICEDEESSGHFDHNVGNCIFQTTAMVYRLPLIKHDAFADELEWRVTIAEHMGGRSLLQLTALGKLGTPFSDFAQGALTTLDVRFRPGGPTQFKPYVALDFAHEALVDVVLGPAIKNSMAGPTLRRMLDRNGFRHTALRRSTLPYQT
jgi:hypothetical protein